MKAYLTAQKIESGKTYVFCNIENGVKTVERLVGIARQEEAEFSEQEHVSHKLEAILGEAVTIPKGATPLDRVLKLAGLSELRATPKIKYGIIQSFLGHVNNKMESTGEDYVSIDDRQVPYATIKKAYHETCRDFLR